MGIAKKTRKLPCAVAGEGLLEQHGHDVAFIFLASRPTLCVRPLVMQYSKSYNLMEVIVFWVTHTLARRNSRNSKGAASGVARRAGRSYNMDLTPMYEQP